MRTLKISLLVFILSVTLYAQIDGWFWQNPLPQGNTLNAVDYFDNSFGIAVGNYGTIMKTIDGGFTWSLIESNTRVVIYKVDVVSNNVAYALGNYFIIKTIDGGENWFNISNPAVGYLKDIFFFNEIQGYIVGSGGVIFYTEDGGSTWINRNSGTTAILTSVHFLNENFGYAVGYTNDNNVIIKTTNAGLTWSNYILTSPPPYTNSLTDVCMISEQKAFSISENYLLYTSDSGANWSYTQIGIASHFRSMSFHDSLYGVIVGGSGISPSNAKILTTLDGGNNWEETILDLGPLTFLYSLSFLTENFVFAVGNYGRMVYSNDRGTTWEQRSSGLLNTFWDVSFYNENYGIAVGDGIFYNSRWR